MSSVTRRVSSSAGSGAQADDKESLPWRDTDLQVEGPVVAQLQKLFMETWEGQKGPPLAPRDYFPRCSRAARRSCAPSAARPTSRSARST